MLKKDDKVLPFLEKDEAFSTDRQQSPLKFLIVFFAIFVGIYAGFATPDFVYSLTAKECSRPLNLLDEKCYLLGETVIEAYKENPNEFGAGFDAKLFNQNLSKFVQIRNDFYTFDPLHLLSCIYGIATVILVFQHCIISKCLEKNAWIFGVFFDAFYLSLFIVGFYKLFILYDFFHTGANDCIRKIMY